MTAPSRSLAVALRSIENLLVSTPPGVPTGGVSRCQRIGSPLLTRTTATHTDPSLDGRLDGLPASLRVDPCVDGVGRNPDQPADSNDVVL
jgi:hypothetical protein